MEHITTSPAWTRTTETELIFTSKVKVSERPVILSSADGYNLLLNHCDHNQLEYIEQFKLLLAHKVLGIYEVSSGRTCSTHVNVKLIFTAA